MATPVLGFPDLDSGEFVFQSFPVLQRLALLAPEAASPRKGSWGGHCWFKTLSFTGPEKGRLSGWSCPLQFLSWSSSQPSSAHISHKEAGMIVVIRAATGLWEGRVHRGNQNSVCQPWGPLPFGFKDPALWCCISQKNKLTRGACVCCLSGHTATIPVVTGSRFGRLALLPRPQARDGSEGLCRSRALWRCRQGAWEWVLERSEMGAGTQLTGMGGAVGSPSQAPVVAYSRALGSSASPACWSGIWKGLP